MERSEALALNLKTYTTGRPCKRGHYSYRYTNKKTCAACKAEDARAWRESHKEEHNARLRAWRHANPDHGARHYHNNPERHLRKNRIRRGQLNERSVFKHELKAIQQFYRDCPDTMQVDHIVPLNNPLVCGLHCLANLQYLSQPDNASKGNSFTPF